MGARRLIWTAALLLVILPGCQVDPGALLPAEQNEAESLDGLVLVARFVHVTDTHMIDTESPARFAGAQVLVKHAWRPYEAYSMQLLDGVVRAVNRMHAAGMRIDFLLHTGDACDNAQSNELEWLTQIMAGGTVNPLSGPDDRSAEQRPPPQLDPYAPFAAEGLYRNGVHGDEATIAWYAVFGNHDVYAIGTFPILETEPDHLMAALPLPGRPGVAMPTWLDPLASYAHGPVTPGDPGPPRLLEPLSYVEPNASRAYFEKPHYVATMLAAAGQPVGHGFAAAGAPSWYSVSPVPGLRLIGLDTTDRTLQLPAQVCYQGAISQEQFEFLRSELDAAAARGELVIIAGHHPSQTIHPDIGVEVTGDELRDLLKQYRNVVLYMAGHLHRNRVIDRGGYLEIETCSTLDLPQEGRVVEVWRDPAGTQVVVSYRMFTHDESDADDALRPLRDAARAIALGDKRAAGRQRELDPSGADPRGGPADREGVFIRP
jgi:3',5'-cyclic AMP phosphodiesterase CpdA